MKRFLLFTLLCSAIPVYGQRGGLSGGTLSAPSVTSNGIVSALGYVPANSSITSSIPAGVITNNQRDVTLTLTDSVIVDSTLYPSNIVLNAQTNLPGATGGSFGFIKYVPGTKMITSTNGVFSRFKLGDNFVWKSDNSQVLIARIINSNTAVIFHSPLNAGITYDGVSWDFYPNALNINDINGRHVGWVGNDGTYGIDVDANSGVFMFLGRSQSFQISPRFTSTGSGFSIFASPTNISQIPDVFTVDDLTGNFYECIRVRANGQVFFNWGVTNNGPSALIGETEIGTGGIKANGGGFKHARVTTGSVSGGATALVTVPWTTAFADANYTVNASVLDSTAAVASIEVVHVESITTTNVVVRVNNTAAGAVTGTVHVIAVHD